MIQLHLALLVDYGTLLCDTEEKNTMSNNFYLIKKLFELHLKEVGNVSAHLNEFNILLS